MIRRLTQHIVLLLSLICLSGGTALAQCIDTPRELLEKQAGLDALLIEQYQVRLKEGTSKRPLRVRRMDIKLEANIKYRLSLYQPDSSVQEAVLQLYDHRELLGSTFDIEMKKDIGYFEYVSEEEVYLQMVLSSKVGKKTCATALLSMVLEDTTTIYDTRVTSVEQATRESLYIGIDNPVKIAASGVQGGYLEVSVSQGTIRGEKGNYLVRVERPGLVVVKVRAFKQDGTLREESETSFMALPIPDPVLTLAGQTGGAINSFQLLPLQPPQLQLIEGIHQEGYEVLEFAFSKSINTALRYRSNGPDVSIRQKQFFQNLSEGSEFFLIDVVIRTPQGEEKTLPPIRFRLN